MGHPTYTDDDIISSLRELDVMQIAPELAGAPANANDNCIGATACRCMACNTPIAHTSERLEMLQTQNSALHFMIGALGLSELKISKPSNTNDPA